MTLGAVAARRGRPAGAARDRIYQTIQGKDVVVINGSRSRVKVQSWEAWQGKCSLYLRSKNCFNP